MRKIEKGKEPHTLTKYRSKTLKENLLDESIYNDFPDKTREGCNKNDADNAGNLRRQLLEEQGYLCCYCMSRISCDKSKIEHFKDQSTHREDQINYQNLFVACQGNEGQPKDKHHCDTAKGSLELTHINLLSHIENQISYLKSGEIESTNKGINREINEVLNLNYEILADNRKVVYEQFIRKLQKKLGHKGNWSQKDILKQIKKYEKRDSRNQLKQFNGMILYFLRKKLLRGVNK